MTLARIALPAFVLCSAICVRAQAAQETAFRVETNIVFAPVLVTTGDGQIVYGLKAKDFILEDDDVPQAAHLDESEEPEPVSLVIAVQTGRSARDEFKRIHTLGAMLEPALSQGRMEAAIVVFDGSVELLQDFTAKASLIDLAVNSLPSGDSGAAILDAVQFSVQLLDKAPKGRQRMLLLISETRDHGSHVATVDKVVSSVGSGNTVIYALAFSPGTSNFLDTMRDNEVSQRAGLTGLAAMTAQAFRKNVAKTIAALTGGEYEVFRSQSSFEARLTDFMNHLRGRYLLSFEPKNPHPGIHRLRVQLKDSKGTKVLVRNCYWAKGK